MTVKYYGGSIFTGESIADELYISDGRVVPPCVTEREVNISGKSIVPAFYDAHGHFIKTAFTFLQPTLGENPAEELRHFISENNIAADEWITASGNFSEELDSIDNPILVQKSSGHGGYFNRAAMVSLGVPRELSENEYFAAIKNIPASTEEKIISAVKKAEELYLRSGILTVQEGYFVEEMLPMYRLIAALPLKIRIIAYTDIVTAPLFLKENFPRNISFGGIKIFLDGSPQDRTAWISGEYIGGGSGAPTMTEGEVTAAMEYAAERGIQLLAHCNGDMAIERFLSCMERVSARYPNVRGLRFTIIHAQLMTAEQTRRAAELGAIVSFFAAHVYHFGDIHLKNLGSRAEGISPLSTAIKSGCLVTIHNDSPVISPDLWQSIGSAVNRRTKGGVPLREGEKISLTEAIKAVTKNAAAQYGECGGTLESGSNADFIITDRDIFSIPAEELPEVKAETVYRMGELI